MKFGLALDAPEEVCDVAVHHIRAASGHGIQSLRLSSVWVRAESRQSEKQRRRMRGACHEINRHFATAPLSPGTGAKSQFRLAAKQADRR